MTHFYLISTEAKPQESGNIFFYVVIRIWIISGADVEICIYLRIMSGQTLRQHLPHILVYCVQAHLLLHN